MAIIHLTILNRWRVGVLVALLGVSPPTHGQIQPVNWTHLSSATGDLPVPPASNGQSGLKVVDLDKNGQLDYVLTLWLAPQTVVWYRHIGENFEPYVIDTQTPNLSHGEGFKDIDGDGDIDLLIGDASSGDRMYWWENPYPNYDPNVPWVRRLVRDGGGLFYHDNIWGDFDGDGQDELISWNQYSGLLLLFEIPADPRNSGPWPVTTIFSYGGPALQYRGAEAIDINLDGKEDFVGGGGWFEHTAGVNFIYHPIDPAKKYSQIKAGQFIPGGRPEVVCVLELESGPLSFHQWNGSQWVGKDLLDVPESHTLQVGDVNGDGHLDIVTGQIGQTIVSGPTNPNATLWVLYGDGAGNFTHQILFPGQGDLEGQLADIDNDGDLDLLAKPFRHNSPRMDIHINEGFGPIIEPRGGVFDGEVTVSLSSQAGNGIYYTTDGTTPTSNSTRYTGPFILSVSSTVKALSTQNGIGFPGINSAVFAISADRVPPVILSVQATQPGRVTILFSEPLEQSLAQVPANYAIDRGVSVTAAQLDVNQRTVRLTTTPLSPGIVYTLGVSNLRDKAPPGNQIPPGSTRSFGFESLPSQDLALWFKADEGTGVSGQNLSQWNDQSGNNRHGTQLTSFSQPKLKPQVINGTLPAIQFDGANDYLEFPLPVNGLGGLSLFLVAADTQNKPGGSSQAEQAALFWNETAFWGTVYLSPFQSSVNLRFGTTQPGNQMVYQRPGSVGSAFTLTTAVKSGTTDTLYVNGTQVLSQGGKLPTIAGCRDTGNVARGFDDNTFFGGDIAEVLVYRRALTAGERESVGNYLMAKYQLGAASAPAIVQSPASSTVAEPESAGFIVVATGTGPLSYQWRRNGAPIPGATQSSYTLTPTSGATDNGAQFSVVVSNAAGSVASAAANLTVTLGLPLVLTQPVDRVVIQPGGATFSVQAAGAAPLSYQWWRDGAPIIGATGNQYTLNPTSRAADDGAGFSVVVSNASGVVTSAVARLTVTLPLPVISVQPSNLTVMEPDGATFSVQASGGTALSYQWWREGAPISGAAGPSYTLDPTARGIDNGARFRVVVSDGFGAVTSAVATLTVLPPNPRVTEGLVALYDFSEGVGATVHDVSGVGPPLDLAILDPTRVQWVGGSANGLQFTSGGTAIRSPGAAKKILAALASSGRLSLEAWIKASSSTQTGLAPIATLSDGPASSQVNLHLGEGTGNGASFRLRTRGNSFSWLQTDGVFVNPEEMRHVVVTYDGTLQRIYVDGVQQGVAETFGGDLSTWNSSYPLVLGNESTLNRSWLGSLFLVAVYDRALALDEIQQNKNSGSSLQASAAQIRTQPANLTVTEPAPAVFSVGATGTAPFGYQWRRNGMNIPGANGSTYTVSPTSTGFDNQAEFDVIVSNALGAVTSVAATLTVKAPMPQLPSIQIQPADLTVVEPSQARFTVAATGAQPLVYLWRRNGSPLAGAVGESYLLNPTAAAADQGARFDVVVSNNFGAVTSRVAALTVSARGNVPTAGLVLWLRADAGIVPGVAGVTRWLDQSGHNRHATQVAAGSQPSLVSGAVAGLPALRFDGADDYLTFVLPVNGLGGISLFIVAANTPNQGGGLPAESAALFWNRTLPEGGLHLSPFQSVIDLRFGTTQTGNRILYNRPSAIGSNFTLTEAIKAGSTEFLYVDESLVAARSARLPTLAGCRDMATLGRGYLDNTFFAGDIAEVLVYDRALSASERQVVEDWLSPKYGLQRNLALSPQITIQPSNLTVVAPNPATFTVGATGTGPLLYQWRRGGVPVGGTGSAGYTVIPTSTLDNGAQFDVVISNSAGSVTSAAATLTVLPSSPAGGGELPALKLSAVYRENHLLICWPEDGGNYVLQATDSLGEARVWSDVAVEKAVRDNQNCVMLPLSSSRRFFRLGLP